MPPPLPSFPPQTNKPQVSEITFFNDENINIKKCKIEINSYNALQILNFGLDWFPCFVYFTCIYVNTSDVLRSIPTQYICIYLPLLLLG